MTDVADIRAKDSEMPKLDSTDGIDTSLVVICESCTPAMRAGAIRPFSVISAKMPSTITTTKERRLPRPSSTSAREPQPFDITMP